jgi:hypothetical protein
MSTEHKHTPGPWRYVYAPSRGHEVHWGPPPSDEATNIHRPVCHMRWTDGLRPNVEETVKADAALIAAAPDLRAACEAAFHTLEALNFDEPIDVEDNGIDSLIEQLRAAIRLAQPTTAAGEQP